MDQRYQMPVYVAHADPIIAAGIRALLENDERFSVSHGRMCEREERTGGCLVIADRPRALSLLANRMRQPGQATTGPRLLVVSTLDREQDIRAAITAGVDGYVLQGCSAEELTDAAAAVASGHRYIAGPIADRLAESLMHASLTARENGVLELIASGQCNKAIARELDISIGTVKSHVRSILAKLSASSRVQAVYYAQNRGLVSPAPNPVHAQSWSSTVASTAFANEALAAA